MWNEFFNYIENMARKFLLCFHDFSVWNFQKVTPILEEIKDLVGAPFSVLVIPDTEKADAPVVEEFRETLSRLASEGFELALHGYKHKAEFSQGRNYMGLIGMNLTGGEAEFAGLSEFESERLLWCGLEAWNKLVGSQPVAFVPPTWYSNGFLPMQVRKSGMLYEGRSFMVSAAGKRYASPVVSFAGILPFMQNIAFAYGKAVFKLPVGVPRLALHPSDFPQLEGRVRDLIRLALGSGRKLSHYKDL
jgi:hypothetical protein